jgi:hypothetical protein
MPRVRYSEAILTEVLATYDLGPGRADELIREAAKLEDGNRYLRRSELEAAAEALASGARADTAAAARLKGFRWSEAAVEEVLEAHGLDDPLALLSTALTLEDANRYLRRSELEAAAKRLTGRTAGWGVISDLDKTVLPRHEQGDALPPPYPGVRALFDALELADGAVDGDVSYVTARPASVLGEVPRWMGEHDLPVGSVDTGPARWSGFEGARLEKIRDIERRLEASPDTRFVLFGDSSHVDADVYREIKERYPDRIAGAVIHRVTRTIAPERVAGLHLVDDYAQAAAKLFADGVIDEATARRVMVTAQLEGLDMTDAGIDALLAAHRP